MKIFVDFGSIKEIQIYQLKILVTELESLSLPKVSRNKFQDYERNIWRIHSQTKSR